MKKLLGHIETHQAKVLTFLDQGLVSGVNFLVGIMLARFLGLAEYGTYALLWMFVLFFSSVQQNTLVSALYSLSARQLNKHTFYANLHVLQILFSVLAAVLVLTLGSFAEYFLPEEIRGQSLMGLSVVCALYILNDFLRRLGFVTQKQQTVLLMDLISWGLQPVSVLILSYFDVLNLQNLFYSLATLLTLSVFVGTRVLRPGLSMINLKKTSVELWNFSRYLLGTSLLQWLAGNFYLICAAGILGPVAFGAIRIAQNIMGVMHVLLQGMENIIPARAAQVLHQNGSKATFRYIYNTTVKGGVLFAILLFGIALFRERALSLIYGPEFLEYSYVLLAFCGIYLLIFFSTQLRFLIRTFEKNQMIFWSYVIAALLGLSLAKPLITSYGVMGVIAGLLLTQVTMLVTYILSLKNELTWKRK